MILFLVAHSVMSEIASPVFLSNANDLINRGQWSGRVFVAI